ncbi:LysR substrate-binding domain-containing protein [Bordetella trematum]|uniref:LysR substrate-binding domain-containing protein n=1 Tax=Bordetella trematum TaxID=123899 RepID=UPI0012682031|nr:LysR substrate-binding domain-containing protein [Bordetella trematum]
MIANITMSRRLPPLKALQVFEATARLRSFAQAAQDLHVTPAAVSQQIKSLEEWFGFAVFRRTRAGLELTERGESLAPSLKSAFDLIQAATEDVTGPQAASTLTLSVLPNFAMRWLIPRLPDFTRRHPWIQIKLLSVTHALTDFYDTCDLAIRAYEHDPQFCFEPLVSPDMVPMLSPQLYRRSTLLQPDELLRFPLLHITTSPEDWPRWFRETRQGAERLPDPALLAKGHQFDSYVVAVEAALAGMGVVLGRPSFATEMLRRKELLIPFERPIASNKSWYLVYPRAELPRKCRVFREWLLSICAAR